LHIKASREDWEQLKGVGKLNSISNLGYYSILANVSSSVYLCGNFDGSRGRRLDSENTRLTKCFCLSVKLIPAPHSHPWTNHWK
ncbi:hypothetical protein B0T20DRAFT_328999, partial [Sordaria brevicollis]